nr:MAG TPA: hypothetical protein [Caudoviricetes sp.]
MSYVGEVILLPLYRTKANQRMLFIKFHRLLANG